MKVHIKEVFSGKLLKRFLLRRLRWILRGHRVLKKADSQGKIYAVMQAVATAEFRKNKVYSKIIFGAAVKDAELAVQQYLLTRTVIGTNFSKSLLYACGKPKAWVIHPLPPEWREVVRQHGFIVPKFWSALVWNCFVMLLFLQGILSMAKKIFNGIKSVICSYPLLPENFVFFDGLTAGNMPQSSMNGDSYDIISWYWQWSGRVDKVDMLCHDLKGMDSCTVSAVPVVMIPSAIPSLTGFGRLVRYIGWCFVATSLAIVNLCRGRWWHALLLKEASFSAAVRMQNPKNLARDYLFHNSNWIYRPLWTYEAMQQGSRITFYFYSTTSGAGFKRSHGYPLPYFGFSAMNWPYYLVWDKYQADSLRRVVERDANISIVGPVWFSSNTVPVPKLPRNTIAVFDIQPVRAAFYQTFGIDFDYYTSNTALQFLSDIYNVVKSYNDMMALKRKRNLGKLVHPQYQQFIKHLDGLPNFVSVDPDLAAIQLIKECKAVISMPFTSTAIIGRELGKPSIYYDPHGLIQKDDRGAHGVEILCGQQELSAWMATISNLEVRHE